MNCLVLLDILSIPLSPILSHGGKNALSFVLIVTKIAYLCTSYGEDKI